MTRWSRSEVAWRPAERRRRFPVLLLSVVAAAVAVFGYAGLAIPVAPGIGSGQIEKTASVEPLARKRERGPEVEVRLSTEPRVGPLPRQAASPRQAPAPRAAVREAAMGATR